MTCLLCGQHLGSNLTFRNLLFLKKEAGSLCFTCSSSFEKIGEEHCPTCYKAGVSTSCQRAIRFMHRLSKMGERGESSPASVTIYL